MSRTGLLFDQQRQRIIDLGASDDACIRMAADLLRDPYGDDATP